MGFGLSDIFNLASSIGSAYSGSPDIGDLNLDPGSFQLPTSGLDFGATSPDASSPDLGNFSLGGAPSAAPSGTDLLASIMAQKNDPTGAIIAGIGGPTVGAIGAGLIAANNPATKLGQAQLAQQGSEFGSSLAQQQAQLAEQKAEADAANKLKAAALALQAKLARAQMIQNAYAGLATTAQTGGTNNANALQRIVDNIHFADGGKGASTGL